MTVRINAKIKTAVDIKWREELVEGPKSFYIKLSPDVTFSAIDAEVSDQEIDRITAVLNEAAKKAKVNR